jgi:hypothetical protein
MSRESALDLGLLVRADGLLSDACEAAADIGDLETQPAQHASRAASMYAAAEVVWTERASGRVPVCDAENGFGIVFFAVEDQQIGGGVAEMMAREELLRS